MKNKILFFGEIPPNTYHGISLANYQNINTLKIENDIEIIEEYYPLNIIGSTSKKRYVYFILNFLKYLKGILKSKYDFLYITLSTSLYGKFKTILLVFLFKLINKNGMPIVFLQRSDLTINNSLLDKLLMKLITKSVLVSLAEKFIPQKLKSICNYKILSNQIEIELNFEYDIRKSNYKYLFLSNFSKKKGFYDVLNVFEKLSNLNIDFIGNVQENEIHQIIKRNYKNISFSKGIYGVEKFELIKNYKCIIIPSHLEGQPTILLEAMMMGIPVITTNVGDIENMLPEQYPFIYKAKSKENLKNLVLNFELEDEININNLSNSLKAKYQHSFSKKNQKNKLLNIFKNQ